MQKKREDFFEEKLFFEQIIGKVFFRKIIGKKFFSKKFSSNFTREAIVEGAIIRFFRVY